jgi:two-component sensor histidine kinase
MTRFDDTPEQLALRQLRHHTKNALQRLLCEIAACPGLQRDPAGRALAEDLERRIRTSASLSDALFGLTGVPRSLDMRLLSLGKAVVELMADSDQEIGVIVAVEGVCPPGYDDVLVRVAHELIGNAVKHGMQLRLIGNIEVAVDAGLHGVTLSVIDDGWGMCLGDRRGEKGAGVKRGEGLRIAALLAEQHGGTLVLSRDRCKTVAMMRLPPRATWQGMGL